MDSVAVVLLNWNGRNFLEKFLPPVIENSPGAKIVVADNHSTDGSVQWIEQHFPQVCVIRFEKNLGFCKGYNEALKRVEAEYYMLLNTDVETTPGWLEPLADVMRRDCSIAVCQPKVRAFYNKQSFEYAGAAGGFIDALGYPFCRGRIFETLEEDHGQYDDERDIFWASGACFFIRSELFHRFGGFDERFFAHMEEIDLCWRLAAAGYRIVYSPLSLVYHVGGGALPQSSPKKTYLNFRNNLLMLLKNLPASQLWWKIPFRIGLDWLAIIRFFLKLDFRKGMIILKAHKDALSLAFKNHSIAGGLNEKNGQGGCTGKTVYSGSALLEYFLMGKRKFSDLKFQ